MALLCAEVLLTLNVLKNSLFAKVHDGVSILPLFVSHPLEFYKNIFAAIQGTSSDSECPFSWCSTDEPQSFLIPSRNGNRTLLTHPSPLGCCLFWRDEVKLMGPWQLPAGNWVVTESGSEFAGVEGSVPEP